MVEQWTKGPFRATEYQGSAILFLKKKYPLFIRHSGVKPHTCTVCDKRFSDSSNLARHVRAVHEKMKPHKCSDCGKAFAEAAKLSDYKLTHSGVKTHSCDMCDAETSTRSTGKKFSSPAQTVPMKCTSVPRCGYCVFECFRDGGSSLEQGQVTTADLQSRYFPQDHKGPRAEPETDA